MVGGVTSLVAYFVAKYKYLLHIDEGLDIFAIHGVGGIIGDILTGFFASKNVPAMDGVSQDYSGGWWDQNFKQMGIQLAAAFSCALWSFAMSCALLFVINLIPGCKIRVSEEEEVEGLDSMFLDDGPLIGDTGNSDADMLIGVPVKA